MRNKNLFAWLILPLVVLLAACSAAGASSTGASTTGDSQTAAQGQNQSRQAPDFSKQPIEMKLAVGTLKLEGTPQAVTTEQAKTLLPLWKAVKSMSSSSSASQQEISALYTQIKDAMTAEQVQAIEAMSLSMEDTRALMEQYNIQLPAGGPGNLSESERATRVAEFQAQGGSQGGDFPGGGFPGGDRGGRMPGGGMPGGQIPGAQNIQRTPRAEGTRPAGFGRSGGFGGGMNTLFVEPLIKLLEQRAGA